MYCLQPDESSTLKFSTILRNGIITSVVIAAVIGTAPVASASNRITEPAPTISSAPAEKVNVNPDTLLPDLKAYPEAVSKAYADFKLAQADAEKRVNDTASGGVTTPKLVELAQAVTNSTAALSATNLPHEMTVALVGLPSTPSSTKTYVEDVNTESANRVKAVTDAVTAWESELSAEKERIRVAEEKRKAEEAARAAAAAAAAKAAQAAQSTQGNNTAPRPTSSSKAPATTPRSSAAAPRTAAPAASAASGESAQARVNRIAAGLGFIGIPVVIQSGCGSIGGALACYTPGSGVIAVTPAGLGRSDCTLRIAIAHEWKHHLQNNAGQIQFDAAGNITNRAWLESDANAFGYRYGC